MKQILRIFDYLFILKPVWLFPVWMLFLAGYYLESELQGAVAGTNGLAPRPFDNLLIMGAALTLLMGAVFALHQVMDRESLHRSRVQLISPGHLTPKSAFIESVVLLVLAILAGFVFSVKIGLVFLLVLLITGYFYSFSPFRFKDSPVAAMLINGLGTLAVFCVGWFVNGHISQDLFVSAMPYVFAIMAIHVYASVPEKDKSEYTDEEKNTFALKYGLGTTVYVGLLFELIALALSYYLQDELIFYPTFFSLPFFIWAAISVDKVEMVRAVKYPIFILAITLCFKWGTVHSGSVFFYFIACVYLFSKFYYRLSFGVNYPTMAVHSHASE